LWELLKQFFDNDLGAETVKAPGKKTPSKWAASLFEKDSLSNVGINYPRCQLYYNGQIE